MTPADMVVIKTIRAKTTVGARRNLNFLLQWIQPSDFAVNFNQMLIAVLPHDGHLFMYIHLLITPRISGATLPPPTACVCYVHDGGSALACFNRPSRL